MKLLITEDKNMFLKKSIAIGRVFCALNSRMGIKTSFGGHRNFTIRHFKPTLLIKKHQCTLKKCFWRRLKFLCRTWLKKQTPQRSDRRAAQSNPSFLQYFQTMCHHEFLLFFVLQKRRYSFFVSFSSASLLIRLFERPESAYFKGEEGDLTVVTEVNFRPDIFV